MERPDNGEWMCWETVSQKRQNTNQRRAGHDDGRWWQRRCAAGALFVLQELEMQDVRSYWLMIRAGNCEK